MRRSVLSSRHLRTAPGSGEPPAGAAGGGNTSGDQPGAAGTGDQPPADLAAQLAAAQAAIAERDAEVEKWKTTSRKHEERAGKNAGAVTENQTLAERMAALEARNAELEKADQAAAAAKLRAELVAEVAKAKNVDAETLALVAGDTKEALEAFADRLGVLTKPAPRWIAPGDAGAGNAGGTVGGPAGDWLRDGLQNKGR